MEAMDSADPLTDGGGEMSEDIPPEHAKGISLCDTLIIWRVAHLMESTLTVLAVIAGAFSTVILELKKPTPTAVAWLKRMFVDRSDSWYERVDFMIVWICGSLAGYFLYNPKDAQQAFMAGIGFVSLLRVAAGKFEPKQAPTRARAKRK
jgi:hypothetical protein